MAASAGSFYSTYRIDLSLLDQDIAAAKQRLTDLQTFAAKPVPVGAGGGAGIGAGASAPFRDSSGAAQQAERDTLRYATALATAQKAQGDLAGAVDTYRTALSSLTPNTVEALQATTRLTQAEAALQRQLGGTAGFAQQFSEGIKSGLLSIVGPAALAAGAIRAVSEAGQLIQLGAQAEAARISFDNLAHSVGASSSAMLTDLRAAAAGTVSDANLIQSANSGILLTGGKLASELPRLLEIARASAQATGDDVGFVFDSLVKGIARGSPQIIDNAKITLDAEGAFQKYAASIGKTSDQLTRTEQQQATLNAVLEAGSDIIQKTGGAAETNASKLARLSAQGENIKAGFGVAFVQTVGPAADLLGRIGQAAASAGDGINQNSTAARDFTNALTANLGPTGQFLAGIRQIDEDLIRLGIIAPQAAAGQQQQAAASQQAAAASQQAAAASQDLRVEMNAQRQAAADFAQLAQQVTQAQTAQANSAELAGVQARAAAEADRLKSNADQVGAVDAQTHAVAMQQLTIQAQQAAQGLLAGGQQGANTAAILANSSSQVDILTAAYYRLAAAMGAAKVATLNTARTSPGFTDQRDIEVYKGAGLAQQRDQEKAAALAAAEAERQYQKEIGNFAPALARARAELAQLGKDRGTNSAEYINQLTKIHQLEEQATSASRKGRASAGAAHLSDQQKLNNTLLADQTQADNKLLDLERGHQQKLLDIEREFQRKSLEQQRQNEVSKRQSRADFYDSLTQSSKELGAKESQALSAEYEAAYAKAQQIAQAGNQKLANDYLAMRQRQIQQEIEYQKARAKAVEDGDKGEVERLDQIQKLRQDQQAEEEKQLLAGGDANQNARTAAIDTENQAYADQADKIVTASDRATQAKITNAQRSGKAVSDENALLKEQADYYDRIRARTGVPASAAAGVAPEAPTPTPGTGAAPAEAPAGSDQVWRVFAPDVVDAINAQTERLSTDLAGVTTAVIDVGKRVQNLETAIRGLSGRVMS